MSFSNLSIGNENIPYPERQHRVVASLRETLSILNSNRSMEEILQFIVHQAREILEAQAVAIYCPTGQNWLMQIQTQEGLSDAYILQARIPLGTLATGTAALRRQPVAIQTCGGPRSCMICPWMTRGKLYSTCWQRSTAPSWRADDLPQREVYRTLKTVL